MMPLNRVIALIVIGTFAVITGNLAMSHADEKKPRNPQVVPKILKVDLIIDKTNPTSLIVNVIGQVNTGGYQDVKLVRMVNVTPPEDGIQNYTLTAIPPSGFATDALAKVKASDMWKDFAKDAPWLKGVRINGTGKGVMVKAYP